MPKILTNFKYNSNSPNFERDQVKLKSSLGKATLDDYDFGHLVYCLEDKKIYIFQPSEETPGVYTKHNNITGYFLPFEKTLVTKDETIMQRLAVVFCSVPDPEETPNYPNGFEWNLKTDTIIAPQTQEGTQWYLTDADLKPYVWMSTGSFTSDKPSSPIWSKPIRITGADGIAGADGSTQEFIYLLSKKHTSIPTPQYKDEGDKSTFDAIPNYGAAVIPDYIFKDNDGETWRDHPIGVNNTYRYEYVSYRVLEPKEAGDTNFGDWSEPTLWSSYGVWGKDGDGIEYVFINTTDINTDEETPPKPEFETDITNEQKQENEVADYLADWGVYEWKDDPVNPSSNLPLVWVSIRRKHWKENSELESNGVGVWGDFTKPTIWARYSKDGDAGEAGVAQFKSYVFKWSQSKPNKPEDGSGSYDNPVPTDWSDGVPAQTDSETRLWMTTAWFENSDDWSATWTEPQVVSDTADFDAKFSSVENNPGDPTSNPDNWSNDADETTIWMATRKLSQGKWSNWTIAKIKGENGQDGTSIKIKGSYKDLDAFKKDFWDATNNKWKAPTSEDSSYIVASDLYVWDGDSWENVGQFRGEDGTSAYVHIKYANKGENAEGKYDFKTTIGETEVYLKLTGANGEDPGDYIGTFTDSIAKGPGLLDSDRFGKYTWKYWKGEDGYGYEYIYIRTKTATAPSTPTTSNNTNDYVPDTSYDPDWADNATGVSVDYPFEWMCHRVKKDGVWGNWIGSSSDPTKAALWSHYGTGTIGPQGPQGPKGDDGKPGADGGIGPKGARLRMTEYSQYGPNGTASAKTKYLCGKNEGEEFYDVVDYNGTFYLCNVTHTGGSYLPTNTSSGYWTKADYWEFAATKLLLAEKISADDIDVDSLTASDLTVKKLHAVDGNSTVNVDVNGINQSYSDGAGHVMGLVSNKDYLRYRSYYTESGNTVTREPLWIMKDGSGSLANGNISWTADGKIKADTYTPDYYSDTSSSWVLPKIPSGYSKDFTIQYVYASRLLLTYDFTCDDSKSQIIYVWKDGTTAIKTNNGSWMQGTTDLGSGVTPSMTDDNRAGIGFIHCYGHYSSYSGTAWYLVEDSTMAIDDSSSSSGSSSTSGYTGLISIFDKFDTGHYFTFTNGILISYNAEYNQ